MKSPHSSSFGPRKSFGGKPSFGGDRGGRPSFGDRKPFGDRPRPSFGGDRGGRPSFGDRKPFGDRDSRPSFGGDRGGRPSFGDRKPFGDRPSFGDRPHPSFGGDRGGRPSFGDRKPFGDRPSFGDRPRPSFGGDRGSRPAFGGDRGGRPSFGGDRGGRPSFGDRKPFADRPRFGGDARPSFADRGRPPMGERSNEREDRFPENAQRRVERSFTQDFEKPAKSAPAERPTLMNNVMAQATNEADTLTPRKQKAYMRTTPGAEQTAAAETSWGQVSEWYDKHLETEEDTYHRMVILPNLMRLVAPADGEHILELACGQGFFARRLQDETKGAVIDGMDISPELIDIAKKRAPKMNFMVGNAEECVGIPDASYDTVYMVLAIQNVERIDKLFSEANRILKTGGTFHIVMNHPTFRIPKESSWEYVDEKNVQSRRIDAYLSTSKVSMDMHPGIIGSPQTVSFHRPLQTYFKQLTKFNFAVDKLEEWISHKVSDNGPRMDAENRARKEFPLFMYLRAKKTA